MSRIAASLPAAASKAHWPPRGLQRLAAAASRSWKLISATDIAQRRISSTPAATASRKRLARCVGLCKRRGMHQQRSSICRGPQFALWRHCCLRHRRCRRRLPARPHRTPCLYASPVCSMAANLISSGEVAWIAAAVACNCRNDGRQREQFRPLSVQLGVIAQATGSARVQLGETDVIVGVKVRCCSSRLRS